LKILYLSPHPDDVAFSAAARVARDVAAGHEVTVLTLFPPAPGDGPLADVAARKAEDEAFARTAKVTMLDGGWVDAIARQPKYKKLRNLFGPLDDDALVNEVHARISAMTFDEVVAPLGIGQHVDHQVAHQAARRFENAVFYEDAPYVLVPFKLARRLDSLGLRPENVTRGSLSAELSAAARAWWDAPLLRELAHPPHHVLALASILWQSEILHRPARHPPSTNLVPEIIVDRGDKLRAIACYPSQWRMFFPSLEAWQASLEAYARSLSQSGIVERTWRTR
jgi:LmbE family N-acetylglucosaminyl deacetylase